MKRDKTTRLTIRVETLRHLDLTRVVAGVAPSGSQGSYSGICPPPKNGEGGGCVTG